MCGIAGAVGPETRDVVRRMTAALSHRGPDGEGFHHAEGVSLGHRRLSIIDLAGGHQPMANEDSTLFLVCNGEIYNSPELRRQLIAAGHKFRTSTDVEVILHLYEEHGRDCVKHLRGMFAFGLWDERRKQLLLARDHLGQKPLFFARTKRGLAFASEVKAIRATGLLPESIDLDGIWHYLGLRFLPDRRTLFAGIEKLPAATSLLWSENGVSFEKYWDLSFSDKLTGTEDEIVAGLDAVLRETVSMHLLSDVPVGAFLSGGIDSSTVAAIMSQFSPEPVPAFSIGVEEESFNELPYARMVAQRYRMRAHERVVRADLVNLLPEMIHHMDEPVDPFAFGVYLVAREASKEVKVVLGGDGGDENFAGYDRFAGQRLVDIYAAVPLWLRKQILAAVIRRIPESFAYKSIAQKLRWLHEASMFEGGDRYAQAMSFHRFTQESRARLFSAEAIRRIGDPDSGSKILVHYDAPNAQELVDKMLYTDLMTRMPDHLLALVDRMTMAHSLEARSPLVDHKLTEFAARVPAGMKVKGRRLKHVLRRVSEKYLPDEVVHRPKHGFGFPIGHWLRKDLSGFLRQLSAESRFIEAGLFEAAYVREMIEQHLGGRIDHSFRLWLLLNLELWHRLNFEGVTQEELSEEVRRLSGDPARNPASVGRLAGATAAGD